MARAGTSPKSANAPRPWKASSSESARAKPRSAERLAMNLRLSTVPAVTSAVASTPSRLSLMTLAMPPPYG